MVSRLGAFANCNVLNPFDFIVHEKIKRELIISVGNFQFESFAVSREYTAIEMVFFLRMTFLCTLSRAQLDSIGYEHSSSFLIVPRMTPQAMVMNTAIR